MPEKYSVTEKEAQEITGVGSHRLYILRKAGKLPYVRRGIGSRAPIYYERSPLEEYARQRTELRPDTD